MVGKYYIVTGAPRGEGGYRAKESFQASLLFILHLVWLAPELVPPRDPGRIPPKVARLCRAILGRGPACTQVLALRGVLTW